MKLQSNVAILHCHYWILSGPYTLFSACSGSRGAPSWQWCSSCNSCPKHQWYPVSTGCAQAPCWRPGWGQGSNHGCARAHRETWRSRVFDPQGSCDLASHQSIHLMKVVTQQVINLLVCSLIFCSWWSHSPAQMRLRAAGKARLIRWVKPKAKRKDREAPEFVKQQWATGCKNAVADLFSKVNFNQEIWLSIAISNLHVFKFQPAWFQNLCETNNVSIYYRKSSWTSWPFWWRRNSWWSLPSKKVGFQKVNWKTIWAGVSPSLSTFHFV